MGLNRLKRGYLIQFKRYVDQLTGSSGLVGFEFASIIGKVFSFARKC